MKIIVLHLFFLISLCLCCKTQIYNPELLTGAENLQEYLLLIQNRNIGIVANQSSLIGNKHLVDSLQSMGMKIVKVFTPEHGYSGNYDAGEFVENSVNKNNLPIVSLYGENKKPTDDKLKGIDIMLFDLQDVGIRFYTYLSTLHYIMEACAENNIVLIVLDRPNPNAHYIDGPVLDTSFSSFIGLHPVPIVYGMTIGEYAKMINGEGWLKDGLQCKLKIVKCINYTHDTEYILPVKPSPNLPNMVSIYLYPSLCLFEGTEVSIGRGTDFPFQVYGHPDYPKKDFSFIPEKNSRSNIKVKHENKVCYGEDLRNREINELREMKKLNLQWILEMYKIINRGERFFRSSFDLLAGNSVLKEQIKNGFSEEEIKNSWSEGLERFKTVREKYLIYP